MKYTAIVRQLFSLGLFVFIVLFPSACWNAAAEENILRIKAENDVSASYALIGHRNDASNDFVRGEDVQKLFSPYDYVPEVFLLASDVPVDIDFINNNTGDVIVPMGIKTGRTGDIRFTFTGMDNYVSAIKIEFVDVLLGRTIDLTGLASYTYTFNNTATGIQNGRFSIHFYAKSYAVWTPEANTGGTDAQKQDWNNARNWTPAVVPSSNHDIYIPGNCKNYPNLTTATACNIIYFMQGGELGHPNLLTYKRAYVQLNFGLMQYQQQKNSNMNPVLRYSSNAERMQFSAAVSAAPLSRERWYMLSSPLRKVVTGDLGFGGFPLTFLMKFGPVVKDHTNYDVGNWTTTYTSMTEPVTSNGTDGFAFYMYGYGMTGSNYGCYESGSFNDLNDLDFLPNIRSGQNYGIIVTNGILELPFFADSTSLYARRTQVYNQPTNTSLFYYIDDGLSVPIAINRLTGKTESITREANNGNYRFAPENYNSGSNTWEFTNPIIHNTTGLKAQDEFLVGNPYMSSIDMVEFCKDNTASVEPHFKVWNGYTFESYFVDITSGAVTTTNPTDLTARYIAPSQGFFLTYKGGNVRFDVTKISAVRPSGNSSNLRNGEKEENILRLKAENNYSVSYALIGYKEGAKNEFVDGEDVQKLFSPYDDVPEIYSLAGDMPTDINFINNNAEIIVPLGIKTLQTGEIRLTFSGMDNYLKASKIELFDALENRTIDLTGQSSYTYTFNNTETGISNGRFSLRFGNSPTAIADITVTDDLKVYGDSKGIYVVSSASDPIVKVIVYDLRGEKVYESDSDARYYPLNGRTGSLPLIVKVATKSQIKTVKIN